MRRRLILFRLWHSPTPILPNNKDNFNLSRISTKSLSERAGFLLLLISFGVPLRTDHFFPVSFAVKKSKIIANFF